ncbi:hypothetical protein JKP88DRAFT_201443 [Tribonema minus]|uniref:Histone deacetylase domain-containing protein n=1 Tax=Tribonema minus TaxID=303371 RepID=A0A836CB28_9STRA|nr:hypothetical protein JKP88DRAFT_201443 [Tribonema minus]
MASLAAAAAEVAAVASPTNQLSTGQGQLNGEEPATLVIHHSACEGHQIPRHFECPARSHSIMKALSDNFPSMPRQLAPNITREELSLFHTERLIGKVFARCAASEQSGNLVSLDVDTAIMPRSREAITRAAGAVAHATKEVAAGRCVNAFCCVRPPGHHATPDVSMGFCFFNNVGVAAGMAHEQLGFERVAVVDFDVHHGNGTQAGLEKLPYAFFASTHVGYGFYPGTGEAHERGKFKNVINMPFLEGTGSGDFRAAYADVILPALREFDPDIVFISAGFDAHEDDPLGEMELTADDFGWVTREICAVAADVCNGRVVSALEGGYNFEAISKSAVAHVQALRDAAAAQRGRAAAAAAAPAAAEEGVAGPAAVGEGPEAAATDETAQPTLADAAIAAAAVETAAEVAELEEAIAKLEVTEDAALTPTAQS